VFSELARGPESPFAALSGRLGLHPRARPRLPRHAGGTGFPDPQRRTGYADTRDDLSSTAQAVVIGRNPREWPTNALYPSGANLTEALRTGLPQNELKGGGEGLF